jgi:CRP/FNR family transcriptional regulator
LVAWSGHNDRRSAVFDPYFSALTADGDARLTLARERRLAAGEVLFREGEPCAGMFIVVSGMIKLYKTSADGKEQVLRHMPAGESLNEVPVFDGGANPVSAAPPSTRRRARAIARACCWS